MTSGLNGNVDEMENKIRVLDERFLSGKLREKKLIINIHKKEREIS